MRRELGQTKKKTLHFAIQNQNIFYQKQSKKCGEKQKIGTKGLSNEERKIERTETFLPGTISL